MGEINLEQRESEAIKGIDERELSKLIDEAVEAERLGELYRLRLRDCGEYVASKLHYFEKALNAYRDAKSAKKREETHSYARRMGSDLFFAFSRMKHRMETEERQRAYWYVDDLVYWPHDFTNNLSVTISYRWRKAVEDDWNTGRITFHHRVVARPSFLQPQPKRKPSKAKQEESRQSELSLTWQHLMRSALYTLRDYLAKGGDGNQIPQTFTAVPDRDGYLNNFSLRFWADDTKAASVSGAT
ncbi:hypothetical protein DXT90_18210 [Agrobacterium tumefaciens]|nr:hypothetical protein [Agrobacterium tumefaciens]